MLSKQLLLFFLQSTSKIVKDLDVKNLSHKTDANKKPIYDFITGPLDYGQTYKVSIFATTITKEKGKNNNLKKLSN